MICLIMRLIIEWNSTSTIDQCRKVYIFFEKKANLAEVQPHLFQENTKDELNKVYSAHSDDFC